MGKTISLLAMILTLFLSLSFVSAEGGDWIMYGNSYQPLSQSQLVEYNSRFNTTTITTQTLAKGGAQFNHPTQQIVMDMGKTSENFLPFVEGNFLRVYDSNLNFLTEHFIGMTLIGQISSVDWDNVGGNDQVAGFFRFNSTQLHFKVFEMNETTNIFSEIYDYNFSYPATNGITGLRCAGNECYTLLYDNNGSGYHWNHFRINSTDVVSSQLFSVRNTYAPTEPPARTDYNNDGVEDYLTFSKDRVVVYNDLGAVVRNWTGGGASQYYTDAKFFYTGGAYWKVATMFDDPASLLFSKVSVSLRNIIDGSTISTDTLMDVSTSADTPRGYGLAVGDYDNDGTDEVWAMASRMVSNRRTRLTIYNGDGSQDFSALMPSNPTATTGYPQAQLTLARMDTDNILDVVLMAGGGLFIYSPAVSNYIYTDSSIGLGTQASCVPADLTFNNNLELVCTSSGAISLQISNYTNQNPTISTVAYDPSTIVSVGTTVNAFITATDAEDDAILYSGECDEGEGYSSDSASNIVSCTYTVVGEYNLTVRVRDNFHSEYNSFSQEIIVTSSGEFCDNDGICEAEQGEDSDSCPADCPVDPVEEAVVGQDIVVPAKIVDTEDTDQGLLPEIYYGLLALISNTFTPLLVLIVSFIVVLIVFALVAAFKNFANRV